MFNYHFKYRNDLRTDLIIQNHFDLNM